MHILFYTTVLTILRLSAKHANFWLGVQFHLKQVRKTYPIILVIREDIVAEVKVVFIPFPPVTTFTVLEYAIPCMHGFDI